MSRRLLATFGLSALIAVGYSVSALSAYEAENDEQEVEITIDQAPAAVQETIKSLSSTGNIIEIEKEVEDGATIYSVEIKDAHGKTIEHEISTDGKVLESEVEEDSDKD